MKAYVIIGACFGDEGKGLTTDYLAAKHAENSLVVRFNGGAQAGHTVQTTSGQRHVFKHFGAGSFSGSPTYLSEFFICNPLLFRAELEQLENFNLQPKVFVNAKAVITTPYDMILNQMVEAFRDTTRHGSCGVGINETVERNLYEEFSIQAHELFNRKALLEKLRHVQQKWVPRRLEKLGIHQISSEWQERLSSPGIMEYFLDEVEFFLENCTVADNSILQEFSTLIFEGAQGLLLDEEKGDFPYVTRSYTGLKNILTIAKEAAITTLEVFYVARAYLTRHGVGPLPFELAEPPYANIHDKTNVNNMYQGSLRFAWLNIDLLQQAIFSDLAEVPKTMHIQKNLLLTCMDQLDPYVQLVQQGSVLTVPKADLVYQVQCAFPNFKLWSSQGATRETISHILPPVYKSA